MTKKESLDASIVTYINTWQKIVESQRNKERLRSITNITK